MKIYHSAVTHGKRNGMAVVNHSFFLSKFNHCNWEVVTNAYAADAAIWNDPPDMLPASEYEKVKEMTKHLLGW